MSLNSSSYQHAGWRWGGMALVIVFLAVMHAPLSAAPAPEPGLQSTPTLATDPHIGYGIHIAPWTPLDESVIEDLGADWIKIYNPDQAEQFPDQRILYRIDVRGMPLSFGGTYEEDMRTLARQLQRQGVHAVEIGNEPNLGPEWGDAPPNAAQYVQVLEVAYRAFKSVAPEITVVSAGLAPTLGTADGMNVNDLDFAQQMLDAGAARHFDAFGYHPYGFDKPPETSPQESELLFRRTERMYLLLQSNGIRDKPMWLTEFGWMRDPAESGQRCDGQAGFEQFAWSTHSTTDQADYIVRAYQFADANWPWVGPMFLWNLDWNLSGNSQVGGCNHMRLFSILQPNGQPYPAYYAFKDMPKRYVIYDNPVVSASVNVSVPGTADRGRANGLTRTMQAGCGGLTRLGSFTVVTSGSDRPPPVQIDPVNGPGLPRTWTSAAIATNGTSVDVFVDTRDVEPGLYQLVVNLRSAGEQRISTHAVRGWLLVHFPTDSECILQYTR